MAKTKLKLPPGIETTDDFKEMVNLLAVYTEAHNALVAMENDCNSSLLEIIDEHKADYAVLQEALTKAESALEVIALRHPEWFVTKSSIGTPYGAVKFYNGTKIEVPNEEVTILLVEQAAEVEAARAKAENRPTKFTRETFIRTEKKLNIEALEGCDDTMLGSLRVRRVQNKSFSVKPAKLDMGKAVKEAVAEEKVAA